MEQRRLHPHQPHRMGTHRHAPGAMRHPGARPGTHRTHHTSERTRQKNYHLLNLVDHFHHPVHFRASIPSVHSGPKFMEQVPDISGLDAYETTVLEVRQDQMIYPEKDLGVHVDLVFPNFGKFSPSTMSIWDRVITEELPIQSLEEVAKKEEKTKEDDARGMAAVLDGDPSVIHGIKRARAKDDSTKKSDPHPTKEFPVDQQVEVIEKSFQDVKSIVPGMRKPSAREVHAVAVSDVLPDLEHIGEDFVEVRFLGKPKRDHIMPQYKDASSTRRMPSWMGSESVFVRDSSERDVMHVFIAEGESGEYERSLMGIRKDTLSDPGTNYQFFKKDGAMLYRPFKTYIELHPDIRNERRRKEEVAHVSIVQDESFERETAFRTVEQRKRRKFTDPLE
eukprot:TRINITY_DN1731_c0_g1_i1.p1 TRINITY_DN1731_c0_g1~~TRINITY_DN1731_c0_g1_i1.p1  ORF type:complete len:392 (+),score=121.75 TRINITY_DN1731_c0_g1_i1:104-1279(+)